MQSYERNQYSESTSKYINRIPRNGCYKRADCDSSDTLFVILF